MKTNNTNELNVRLADYRAAKEKVNELYELAYSKSGNNTVSREMKIKAWEEYEAYEKMVEEMHKHIIPEIGMDCTCVYYSDRSSAVVTKIISPKRIEVKQNGIYSGIKEYTYRKNGHWVEYGTTTKDWGTRLILDYTENYYDMEF